MDTIYKVLDDCEVKQVGERQYEFTASTDTLDRDGEVIEVTGWDLKNFKKNPVIMYAHDYRSLPIGKATKIGVREGKLKNTVEFPPEGTYEFADIVERLVNTGYLKTESVGFIPKEWTDGDDKSPKRTYTKQELLEISIVPVPSNPDALRNAVNDGVITTKEFEAITEDAEKVNETEDIITLTPEGVAQADSQDYTPKEKPLSQEGLKDEFDYLIKGIEEVGLSEEATEAAWDLVREVMRTHGDDIPLDIAEKLGAVLNAQNRGRLSQIKDLAQSILDSAEKPEEPEKESVTSEALVEKLVDEVMDRLDKAQGKVD